MEFAASFSGGKDSTLAIKRMIDRGHRIVSIIVSTREDKKLSWTHNIEREYFKKAADILRCDVIFTDTSVDDYEKNFEEALMESKKLGAQCCVFGDIDIVEHLKWNKERCVNAGIECIHPLLFEDRNKIVDEFLSSSIDAEIIKVDEKIMDSEFEGKRFNQEFVDEIKFMGIDACGENGEFHTRIDLESLRKSLSNEVYIDNASNAFPKAPGVGSQLEMYTDGESFSINRGTYMKAYNLSSKVIDVRDKILEFTRAPKGYQCIFAPSATELINLVIRGALEEGDEIIIDDRMHNSAWRTLEYLENRDINIKVWSSGADSDHKQFKTSKKRKSHIKSFVLGEEFVDSGEKDSCEDIDTKEYEYRVEDLEKMFTENTKAVFLTLVDNITGHYNEHAVEIGRLCAKKDVMFFVDGVQAVCERNINVKEMRPDAFIMTSHIGLMGPEGVAEMIINEQCAKKIRPLIYGGTGSQSNSPCMPVTVPDKFEAGTMNLPGIIATGKALEYCEYKGIESIIEKKHALGKMLRDGLSEIEGVIARGSGSFCSVIVEGQDDAMVAFNLDMINHIMTRVGIQCSPCTHMAEGTFPNGSIRFSVGYFNNEYDIEYIIKSVRENIGQ